MQKVYQIVAMTPWDRHHPPLPPIIIFPVFFLFRDGSSYFSPIHKMCSLATSNLIHTNLLVLSSTRCNQSFLTLMSIRSVLFEEKTIFHYNWVLVVTKLLTSGTQCNCISVITWQSCYYRVPTFTDWKKSTIHNNKYQMKYEESAKNSKAKKIKI